MPESSSWVDVLVPGLVLFVPVLLAMSHGEPPSILLDARSGLPDQDVEHVLLLDEHLLAGTASGVFAYDGLNWTATSIKDTVRWLGLHDGDVWAAGSDGAWRLPADREGTWDFARVPGAPPWLRTGQDHFDGLYLGGEEGLVRWNGVAFESVLDSIRVRCLASHSERGLIVGTMGQGLRILGPRGDVETVLSPGAGVTDTLPGNYVHDIKVGADGTIHLATSWGGYDPRYIGHRNAVEYGVITPRDPHDFRRAAKCEWSPEGWKVEYIYQSGFEKRSRDKLSEHWRIVVVDDIDDDGADEIVFAVSQMREMYPAGFVAFDVETGAQEWFTPLVGSLNSALPVMTSRGKAFLTAHGWSDWGGVVGHDTDDRVWVSCIDATGHVMWSGAAMVDGLPAKFGTLKVLDSWTADQGYYEGPVFIVASLQPIDEIRGRLHLFDLDRLELNEPPSSPIELLSSTRLNLVDGRLLGLEDVYGSSREQFTSGMKVRLVDIQSGEVIAERGAAELCAGGDRSSCAHKGLSLAADPLRGWAVINTCHQGVTIWSRKGVETIVWQPRMPSPVWKLDARSGEESMFINRTRDGSGRYWEVWGQSRFPKSVRLPGGISEPLRTSDFGCDDRRVIGGEEVRPIWPVARIPHTHPSASPEQSFVFMESGLNGQLLVLSREARDRGLLVLSSTGAPLGTLPLPMSVRGPDSVSWITGLGPRIDGDDTRLLIDNQVQPPTIYAFGLNSQEWLREYSVDLPLVDPGCDAVVAVTTVSEDGRFVGTEGGVHEWSRGWRHDASLEPGRVRGIQNSGGVNLSWGQFGIAIDDADTRTLASETDAFTLLGDRVVVSTNHRIFALPSESHGAELEIYSRWDLAYGADITAIGDRGIAIGWKHGRDVGHAWFIDGTLHYHPDVQYYEGASRSIEAIAELADGRFLVAADFNLVLASDDLYKRDLGFEVDQSTLSILENGERWWVSTPEGPWYEFGVQGDSLQLLASHKGRPARDAILQFERGGDGFIYVRTDHSVEKWRGRDIVEVHEMSGQVNSIGAAGDSGIWVGCTDGLWRWSGHGLFRARMEGVPNRSVSRVRDLTAARGPSVDQAGSVLAQCGDALLAFEPYAGPSRAQAEVHGDQVTVGAWGVAPLRIAGVAVSDAQNASHVMLEGESTGHLFVAQLPRIERGRQRLVLDVIGEFGDVIGDPIPINRVVRDANFSMSTWSVLVPAFCLGLWSVDRRRALRSLIFGFLALFALLGIQHFALLYSVEWIGSGFVTLLFVLMGVASRKSGRVAGVDPDAALEELDLLLRGFRHRGSGLNTIDQALILARNAGVLQDESSSFEVECAAALNAVIDSTDDLAVHGPRWGKFTVLDQVVLQRFFTRLDELRETTQAAVESTWSLRGWIVDYDHRQAWIEAARAFLQTNERIGELLKRYRQIDLTQFLNSLSERVGRWHQRSIEVSVPGDDPGIIPVPEREFAEVLENLIGNSLRAMDGLEGGIAIEVTRQPGGIRIALEDDGPGIPEGLRSKVFDRGFSTTGSTGFGLSRCHELVSGWGGTITAGVAQERAGARFEIDVPLG